MRELRGLTGGQFERGDACMWRGWAGRIPEMDLTVDIYCDYGMVFVTRSTRGTIEGK